MIRVTVFITCNCGASPNLNSFDQGRRGEEKGGDLPVTLTHAMSGVPHSVGVLPYESQFCASFPNSAFSDIMLVG